MSLFLLAGGRSFSQFVLVLHSAHPLYDLGNRIPNAHAIS